MKRFICLLLLSILAATGRAQLLTKPPAGARAPAEATITRGPYLQLGTTTAVTIRWRTDVPVAGRVTYGLATTALSGTATEAAATTEHELRLTGLTPDQRYYYTVGTPTAILEHGAGTYFLTAPPPDTKRPIRIASFGDCGNNSPNQMAVRDGFLAYRGDTPTDLWMLIGDNSYEGNDAQYQSNFFAPYQGNLLKNSMLFAIPGNHDYNNSAADAASHAIAYYANFTLPTQGEAGGVASGTEEWYSFDYGPVHFVMLDGYGTRLVGGVQKKIYDDTLNHPQAIWLKQDLAATNRKWVVVYQHFAPYTQGSHNSETESDLIAIRRYVNPILEHFGVDLVVTGHSHVYERSYPLHDQYGPMSEFAANPGNYRFAGDESSGRYDGSPNSCAYKNTSAKAKQGTVYVVSGSAGQLGGGNLGLHPVMAYTQKQRGGSFYLDIEDNRLDARFLQTSSPGAYTVTDQFTILKDVDVVKSLTITAGQAVTLAASFISDYQWSSPGSAAFSASSRAVVVTPTASQTFVVQDSRHCVQDVFRVELAACNGPLVSLKAGDWTDPSVWSCNRVPTLTDPVHVRHVIQIPANAQAYARSVQLDLASQLTYGPNARLRLSP